MSNRWTLARISLLAAALVCALLGSWTLQAFAQGPTKGQAVPGHGGVPGATPGIPGKPQGGKGSGGSTPGRPGATPGTPGQPGTGAGTPGATPGTPSQAGPGHGGDWTLSDLLEGILQMEKSGLKFTHEQAARIQPALQRVIDASRNITETEKKMRSVLTPAQIQFIEEAQRNGKLKVDALGGKPSKPGEDPVVTAVIRILEKKAR